MRDVAFTLYPPPKRWLESEPSNLCRVSVEKWSPKSFSFLVPLKNCLKGPNFVSFFEEKIQTPVLKKAAVLRRGLVPEI